MRAIRRGFLLFTLLTLASNLLAQQSSTTVPNLIRYGGVLKDAQGAAMASRTVGITFLIYGQQDGGAPVWLETQNVATDAAGQYSVLLGSTTATGLPSDLFAQQEQRWLAVKAEGQPEQPRVLLVSVPYAMKAAVADTLAGHSASEFVTTDNLQSAVQQLQGQATTVAPGTPTSTNSTGTAAGLAPVPTNTATNFVDTTTNQVVLVQQNGTGIGLKASSPGNVGVLGTVSSTAKAGIVAGVEGTSSVTNGFGMFGYSTAATGGIGAQRTLRQFERSWFAGRGDRNKRHRRQRGRNLDQWQSHWCGRKGIGADRYRCADYQRCDWHSHRPAHQRHDECRDAVHCRR